MKCNSPVRCSAWFWCAGVFVHRLINPVSISLSGAEPAPYGAMKNMKAVYFSHGQCKGMVIVESTTMQRVMQQCFIECHGQVSLKNFNAVASGF